MNKAVDPILELLNEKLTLNAQSIYLTLSQRAESQEDAPGRTTVYRALEPLEENGYITPVEGNESYYRITAEGKTYLDGDSGE